MYTRKKINDINSKYDNTYNIYRILFLNSKILDFQNYYL